MVDRAASTWWTLGRHQVGSAIATGVDFAAMIVLVQCAGVSAVAATAVGASLGGVTNFLLGRRWIFRRHSGHWTGQAVRYGLVSAASAGLNALGEHGLHDVARLQYVLARVIVSLAVGLLWNFPMQRWFVFRDGRTGG